MTPPPAANDNRSEAEIRDAAGKRAYLRHDFLATGRPGDDWEHLGLVERERWVRAAAGASVPSR